MTPKLRRHNMLGRTAENGILRLIVVGLYSVLLLSLAQTVAVPYLYATRSVDTTISASLILSFVSVCRPSHCSSYLKTDLSWTGTNLDHIRIHSIVARSPPQARLHVQLSSY